MLPPEPPALPRPKQAYINSKRSVFNGNLPTGSFAFEATREDDDANRMPPPIVGNPSAFQAIRKDDGADAMDTAQLDVLMFDETEQVAPPTLIIPSTGSWKERWDLMILTLILYSAVVVPFRVCFDAEAVAVVWLVEVAISLLFCADVALSFFTAFVRDGVWVTSRAAIARQYLQGWFWIDAPSSIPLELLDFMMANGSTDTGAGALSLLRFLRMFRLLRLLKLIKLAQMLVPPPPTVRCNCWPILCGVPLADPVCRAAPARPIYPLPFCPPTTTATSPPSIQEHLEEVLQIPSSYFKMLRIVSMTIKCSMHMQHAHAACTCSMHMHMHIRPLPDTPPMRAPSHTLQPPSRFLPHASTHTYPRMRTLPPCPLAPPHQRGRTHTNHTHLPTHTQHTERPVHPPSMFFHFLSSFMFVDFHSLWNFFLCGLSSHTFSAGSHHRHQHVIPHMYLHPCSHLDTHTRTHTRYPHLIPTPAPRYIYLAHLVACFWFYTSTFAPHDGVTWVSEYDGGSALTGTQ